MQTQNDATKICYGIHPILQGPSAEGSPKQPLPVELSQVAAALRQMRPAPPDGDQGRDDPSHEATLNENGGENDDSTSRSGGLNTDTVDMTALEGRLQKYIDEKFVQLQKQLDERFEELTRMVLEQLDT